MFSHCFSSCFDLSDDIFAPVRNGTFELWHAEAYFGPQSQFDIVIQSSGHPILAGADVLPLRIWSRIQKDQFRKQNRSYYVDNHGIEIPFIGTTFEIKANGTSL